MTQVVVIIDPDGDVTSEVQGMTGRACTDATKALEEALGIITKTTNKADFYRQEVTSAHRIRTAN